MISLFEAAKLLQVPGKNKPLTSATDFLAHIDRGFPVHTVELVARAFAPGDAHFRARIVPKATFIRLRGQGRLNKAQSELVARLAEVWTDARRVWKDDASARGFFCRRHAELGNQRPIDLVFQSEIGAQLVRDVLGRLEHGTAA